jgi:two-component system sensor histidine kinase KdpD
MLEIQVRTPIRKSASHVFIGSVAVALLTLLCYRIHIDLASAIPLYLLVVVGNSLRGDFRSSTLIAALSAACLDYFFTPPLFSVRINNPLNVLALVAFVFTALVVTRLVVRVREEARSSRTQKERLDRLYQLSQQLLSLDPEAGIGEMFLAPFHRLFGVTAVCVFDADTAESYITGDSQNQLVGRTRDAFIRGQDMDDPNANISVRCLRVGGKMMGTIGFEGLHDARETVGSLTALTTALLERTKAFRRASAAAAAAKTEVYRSAVLDALAHEFKTPLATILAAAGGLREAGPLGTEQLELADTVENEAARLGNLTSRLIRTARLDSEEVKPRLELIDIASLVAHLGSQYAARSSDRTIVLPPRGKPIEVLADAELLRLTVGQLIENACKYSQPASTVVIGIEAVGDFAAVRVSNNGSSIAPGERQHIFDRFYRGAETRHTTGSGLGLYIARKIALAHGGALDLEIKDRAADGVVFCLRIPVTKEETDYVAVSQ